MAESLLISVRFHDGRYHGTEDRFHDADGWPPSPARLFQALVAGAARGANLPEEDERALKWLERLDPPRIAAPPVKHGRSVKLFVPNNDLDARGGDPTRVAEVRDGKRWRPCFFDPNEPVVYAWDFDADSFHAARVRDIAHRLYQLGRGIDMAWAFAQVLDRDEAQATLVAHAGVLRKPEGAGEIAAPQPGTLASLVERHRCARARLSTVGTGRVPRQLFRQPPKPSFRRVGYEAPPQRLYFELRGKAGFSPRPLASAATVMTGLRDAAVRKLQMALPDQSGLFEKLIVGRGAGPRDLAQRVRLTPIPSIGHMHADPSIRRIMVEIPAECPIRADDLEWAFAGLEPHHPETGTTWSGRIVSTDDSRMADRFMRPARVFRSMTAVALPNAPRRRIGTDGIRKPADERHQEETRAAGAVVHVLRHAGVRIRPIGIRVQREPFQPRGIRAEHFAAGSRFSKHVLWHVELRFSEALAGPLVIGDGRFCGLGLMTPVTEYADVVAFSLKTAYRIAPDDRPLLIRSLRRALMAIARNDVGRIDRLFSGHEPDGAADRAGHHAHVFLAADGGADNDERITRLIVAAPWAVDRTVKPRRNDRGRFDEVVHDLKVLRAGRLGRFLDLIPETTQDGEPLIGPARMWISATPYVATRNLKKRDDPAAIVEANVVAECHRRGLPAPAAIAVLDVSAGPRGGQPKAKLRLNFATAIRGPLLLGRDSHAGGGLFHAVPGTVSGRVPTRAKQIGT